MADISSKWNLQRSQVQSFTGKQSRRKMPLNSSQNFPKIALEQFFFTPFETVDTIIP